MLKTVNSVHCSHCVLFSCCFMHFWWFLPCSGPLVNQAAFDHHTASSMLNKVELGFRSSNSTALFYCSSVYITCPKSKVFPTADDELLRGIRPLLCQIFQFCCISVLWHSTRPDLSKKRQAPWCREQLWLACAGLFAGSQNHDWDSINCVMP